MVENESVGKAINASNSAAMVRSLSEYMDRIESQHACTWSGTELEISPVSEIIPEVGTLNCKLWKNSGRNRFVFTS